MRLARICITATALALGAIVVGAGGAGAATPCTPGQPPGRPPGGPPGGPPGQPPGRPPQYPPGQCQLRLSAAAAAPRASITAAGSGYAPGSSVALRLGATTVATASAAGDGQFTQAFTVPADAAPGQYDVRATGVGAGGAPYEQSAVLQVLPVQAQQQAAGQPQQAAARPTLIPGLRSGAGLAAAMPGGGSQGIGGIGGNGPAAGVLAGGGLVVLPDGTTALPGSSPGAAVLGGDAATEQAAGGISGTSTGISSSGGFNPLFAVGGGVVLAGLGAGIVMAARRRRSSAS